jgi:hypothetical protein
MTYSSIKFIFHVKIQLLETAKCYQDRDPYLHGLHRFGSLDLSWGGFSAHTTPPVRLSYITALVQLSNITALLPPLPNPELLRNQQETVRCVEERFGTYKKVTKPRKYLVHNDRPTAGTGGGLGSLE